MSESDRVGDERTAERGRPAAGRRFAWPYGAAAARRQRLSAFLEFVATERRRLAGGDAPQSAWTPACDDLLVDAHTALAAYETERGWESALRARQYTMLGLDPSGLAAEAIELRAEAAAKSSLAGWRATAIGAALDCADRHLGICERPCPGAEPADPAEALAAARALLFQATGIRDQGLANEHRRGAIVRRQLTILVVFFVAALVALLILANTQPIDLDADVGDAGDEVWAWTFVFGAIGGMLTAFLSTAAGLAGRVPQARLDARVLAIRPLVGGVAALVAYALLVAELLRVGNGSVAAALVVAFAAGLSERVVTGAAGALADRR